VSELSCGGLAEVADELALGALTGRERARALVHLDTCGACRELIRRRLAVAEGLPGLLPARDPPPGFEAAVMARVGLPVPSPQPGPAAPGATRGRRWRAGCRKLGRGRRGHGAHRAAG